MTNQREKQEHKITSTQISPSLIYGLLVNIALSFFLGRVSQVGHQEKCLRLTIQLK